MTVKLPPFISGQAVEFDPSADGENTFLDLRNNPALARISIRKGLRIYKILPDETCGSQFRVWVKSDEEPGWISEGIDSVYFRSPQSEPLFKPGDMVRLKSSPDLPFTVLRVMSSKTIGNPGLQRHFPTTDYRPKILYFVEDFNGLERLFRQELLEPYQLKFASPPQPEQASQPNYIDRDWIESMR